jgi:hypothetical protein
MVTQTDKPQAITRPQAEVKYSKLLEDTFTCLEVLEASVAAAPNTKLDIKNGTRSLGKCFREFTKIAKAIGMVRSAGVIEQRLRVLQQQHQHQHLQMLEKIKELQEDNHQLRRSLKQSHTSPDTSLTQYCQISVALTEVRETLKNQSEAISILTLQIEEQKQQQHLQQQRH